jgi:hypothetical protein
VAAITWWEIQDGGWLNAPTGLIRADGTRKPGFDALHDLIKGDWWLPPTPMVTDEAGTLRFNGFLGEYAVTTAGQEAIFRLNEPGASAVDIQVGRP